MTHPTHLFVYGTLLAVAQHPMGDLLREKARYAARGSIQARLYIIDDPDEPGQNFFPGALPSPNPAERVYGEVFALIEPAPLLAAFDRFEACSPAHPEPHEFLLRRVTVRLEDETEQHAHAYLYTWDVSTARHVPSGRYQTVSPDVR